jgi:hypothetical protein
LGLYNDEGDGGLTIVAIICRKGGMWVVVGRSRRDGNKSVSERELDLLYAPKIYHLSFIGLEKPSA